MTRNTLFTFPLQLHDSRIIAFHLTLGVYWICGIQISGTGYQLSSCIRYVVVGYPANFMRLVTGI